MIAEFLKFRRIDFDGPTSAKAFKACSTNVSEETFFKADLNIDEEGICQSARFSQDGLMSLMDESIALFRKANLHETAVNVFKLLVPVYEKVHNYEKLASTYSNMKDCYEQVVATMGKRILATFFCVSFYGPQFGIHSGQSFIYKERNVTQLSEIVSRLSKLYRTKFGDTFELVNDSAKFNDKSKLDQKRNYVMVVFVEPYFDAEELKERTTYFDKMNNVCKFSFEMPYTLGGGARGEVDS